MVATSDASLAAASPFSAAVRLSPAACAGPEAHRRYCSRQPGDAADATGPALVLADGVGLLLGPADAAELPPEPQAVRASPAVSAALAKMNLPGIGGSLPGFSHERPATAGAGPFAGLLYRSPARQAGRSEGPACAGTGRTRAAGPRSQASSSRMRTSAPGRFTATMWPVAISR